LAPLAVKLTAAPMHIAVFPETDKLGTVLLTAILMLMPDWHPAVVVETIL
jgi:hypothetical protein